MDSTNVIEEKYAYGWEKMKTKLVCEQFIEKSMYSDEIRCKCGGVFDYFTNLLARMKVLQLVCHVNTQHIGDSGTIESARTLARKRSTVESFKASLSSLLRSVMWIDRLRFGTQAVSSIEVCGLGRRRVEKSQ